jgi:hypothetical protein
VAIVAISIFAVNQYNVMTTTPPSNIIQAQPILGNLLFNIVPELDPNSLAGNAGASSAYTVYHMKNPGVFPIASGTDLVGSTTLAVATAGVTVGIGQSDNVKVGDGYKAYLVLSAYPGTADFLNVKAMLEKNSQIVKQVQTNVDLGADGYPEYLFLLDLSGLGIQQESTAATTVAAYLNVMDNTLTAGGTGTLASIGTSGVDKNIEKQWVIATDNLYDTVAVARVYVTSNRTDDYVQFKSAYMQDFDGTRTVISSPVSESISSTAYTAYFFPAAGVDYHFTPNALLYCRTSGSNAYFITGIVGHCTFPAVVQALQLLQQCTVLQ